MSVAKSLAAGHIQGLSGQGLFAHYIDSGTGDYSVEEAISKVSASEALQRNATPKYLPLCRNFYVSRRVFMRSTPFNSQGHVISC
jgi:hypothetical protein